MMTVLDGSVNPSPSQLGEHATTVCAKVCEFRHDGYNAAPVYVTVCVSVYVSVYVSAYVSVYVSVYVSRRQIPLLPDEISTLHGIQGKTADPGMCAHWKFPKKTFRRKLCG